MALLHLSWLFLTIGYQINSRLLKILWLCKYNHKRDLEVPQLGRSQTTLHALSQTVVLELPTGKVKGDCSLEMGKHVWNCVWMPEWSDHNYTHYFCIKHTSYKWRNQLGNSLVAILRKKENQRWHTSHVGSPPKYLPWQWSVFWHQNPSCKLNLTPSC